LVFFSELHASARVGGKHAPHALRIVHSEHPADEAARGAAHDHERDARRGDDLVAGTRDDLDEQLEAASLATWRGERPVKKRRTRRR